MMMKLNQVNKKPTVYLSCSYAAASGMKGDIKEILEYHDCEIVTWDSNVTEKLNILRIRQDVDCMLMIPPAIAIGTSPKCSTNVGKGQYSELQPFIEEHYNFSSKLWTPSKRAFIITARYMENFHLWGGMICGTSLIARDWEDCYATVQHSMSVQVGKPWLTLKRNAINGQFGRYKEQPMTSDEAFAGTTLPKDAVDAIAQGYSFRKAKNGPGYVATPPEEVLITLKPKVVPHLALYHV